MRGLCLELAINSQLKYENFIGEITLMFKDIYTTTVEGFFYI